MNRLSVEGKKTRWGQELLTIVWTKKQPAGPIHAYCQYDNSCAEIKLTHKSCPYDSVSEEKAIIFSLQEMKSFLKNRNDVSRDLVDRLHKSYMESKQLSFF